MLCIDNLVKSKSKARGDECADGSSSAREARA